MLIRVQKHPVLVLPEYAHKSRADRLEHIQTGKISIYGAPGTTGPGNFSGKHKFSGSDCLLQVSGKRSRKSRTILQPELLLRLFG